MKRLNLTVKFGLSIETNNGASFSLVSNLFIPESPSINLWQRFKNGLNNLVRSLVYSLMPAPQFAG